jgi:uncharacterized membrane protein (DUF106 family)
MDLIFGIPFHLSGNDRFNVMFGVFVISTLVSAIIVIITSKVIDQKEMKELRSKMAKFQEKARAAQKKKDTKQLSKVNKEMMSLQSKMMSKSLKPMIYTMIPIILIFSWLSQYGYLKSFIELHGYVVVLPFSLPIWGTKLKWLGWYILCSFATSPLIKKVFNIETM